jgi:hypothetical protein
VQTIPVIEQEFLPLRAKLLEIGAALDRLEREGVAVSQEPRLTKIRAAIEALLEGGEDRAEQIQLVFSRQYEDEWREKFQMTNDK